MKMKSCLNCKSVNCSKKDVLKALAVIVEDEYFSHEKEHWEQVKENHDYANKCRHYLEVTDA
jgi:hypothetical protein